MFTGLVKDIGTVKGIIPNTEGLELIIESKELISDIAIDDSIAINGACQTATKVSGSTFSVQTVHVSLEKTTLGSLKLGDSVNLELALRLSDRLGGHLVQGHVNDVAEIISIDARGKNFVVSAKLSPAQMKYIVKEGSITIDGISLTVANTNKDNSTFTVSIIPHTWNNTVLRSRPIGSKVNIEVDILGKYVENLLGSRGIVPEPKISQKWLSSKGF